MTASDPHPPPRAFTQGVGTVFQFTGVALFLTFFFSCCSSALISKDVATHTSLAAAGWGSYTGQRAVSICMVMGVLLGLSLAGIGLGLQAQRRWSPALATATCSFAGAFWLFHTIYYAAAAHSFLLSLLSAVLTTVTIALLILSFTAMLEMGRNPPRPGFELLPPDYKIPYSHLHQDPPEVRLAKELEQRRQRLALQQKELEMLEQKLHDKLKQKPDAPILPVDDSGDGPGKKGGLE